MSAESHNAAIFPVLHAISRHSTDEAEQWVLIETLCLAIGHLHQRTPRQTHAIALWSVLFVTILQGMQIDTDHWRHLYLMLGLIWGLAAFVVQLIAFMLIRVLIPDLSARIQSNTLAAGTLLAAGSIASGMLNAAAMSL